MALLARGIRPVVIDAGITLEPERLRDVQRYRETGDLKSLKNLKSGMSASAKGIPLKLSFGSDFPYREASEKLCIQENSSGALPSFALGGLSNVWGAAMLPYRDEDIGDWPIRMHDLASHYRAVTEITHLSQSPSGTMDTLFPSYCAHPESLRLGSQASAMWDDLQLAAAKLQRKGILFGRGRVAVKADIGRSGNAACDYTGLCMYGCPNGSIYNSRDTIMKLAAEGRIEYLPDLIVKQIFENETGIKLICTCRKTGEALKFSGSKVFLGAGVISSARILMESMNLLGRKLIIRDSQYFLFPMMRLHGAAEAAVEKSNTLSQIFVEMVKESGLTRSSHLQIYGYNEMVREALGKSLGPIGKIFPHTLRFLEERILIAQGYLHSDLSGTIETWLEQHNSIGQAPMHVRSVVNPATRDHVRAVVMKLLAQARLLKALPLFPMLQIASPGRGFHSGGTFPMSKSPTELQTDILGRPSGFKNLHVIDSSILPSIPATTITFSVMANAHRIASNCPL